MILTQALSSVVIIQGTVTTGMQIIGVAKHTHTTDSCRSWKMAAMQGHKASIMQKSSPHMTGKISCACHSHRLFCWCYLILIASEPDAKKLLSAMQHLLRSVCSSRLCNHSITHMCSCLSHAQLPVTGAVACHMRSCLSHAQLFVAG